MKNISPAPVRPLSENVSRPQKTTAALNNRHTAQIESRFEGKMALSETQRNILDAIFIAPEFAMYLLLKKKPAIRTRNDAQLFLLANRKELDGFLPIGNRSELIDILSNFILDWSKKLPTHINLEFHGTFTADRLETDSISVARLGSLKIKRKNSIGKFPEQNINLPFIIAKSNEEYFAKVTYHDQVVYRSDPGARPVKPPQPITPKVERGAKKSSINAKWQRTVIHSPAKAGTCPLCGGKILEGEMLKHKRDAHGEAMYSHSSVGSSHMGANSWVRIFQGGAPGLGKGKS